MVASSKSQVVAEQRPPAAAGGGGQAYDGAVSIGGVGLQVVEGLAVLATIPAVLFARELWRLSRITDVLFSSFVCWYVMCFLFSVFCVVCTSQCCTVIMYNSF